MDVLRRGLRTIGYSAWIFSAVLAIAAGALAVWTPVAVLGALLIAAALAMLYVLVQQLHRTPVRGGLLTGVALSITTLLLTVLLVVGLLADSA